MKMPVKLKSQAPSARVKKSRRSFIVRALAGTTAVVIAGCDAVSRSDVGPKVLKAGETANQVSQRALTGGTALAQEFDESDLSPHFRSNGTSDPQDENYQLHAKSEFADWYLRIDGLVAAPKSLSLADLRSMKARTQITRHDCVEGWSAIAKWTGVPLGEILNSVQPTSAARYVMFHCADPMDESGARYYESIDLKEAHHPQTLVAYELNGKPLPIANGAPVRMRIERQLGYKMAKYIMRIELVESFKTIGGGNGGYWEDQGYEWYAGI